MPTVKFDCKKVPEICTNMCYGVNCLGYSSAMFWDMKAAGKPGRTVAGQRGREAGCIRTNGNRCSQKYYGQMHYECDEFPFKSVEPVAANPPFNRCVPKEQNRLQGQWLKKIYYDQVAGLGKKVGWFQIAFENFGGVKYCDRSTGCMNDGNEMLKGETPAKRELAESTIDSPHQHYLTKRGANLFIPNGAEIGDVVYSPRSVDGGNETDSHLDEIVARANATIAEI